MIKSNELQTIHTENEQRTWKFRYCLQLEGKILNVRNIIFKKY